MNNLDKNYINLVKDILENGVEKKTRNGTTLSVFGRTIKFNFKDGKFPLLTTKKIPFKIMVIELIWMLKGKTNIKYLVDNGCHIWDGDCYNFYLKKCEDVFPLTQEEFINKIKTQDDFANKWGDLGPVYGSQWRRWKKYGYRNVQLGELEDEKQTYIDQIQNVIDLLKTNPDSRRIRVSAWNVAELDNTVLPPCHTDFQFYTRELNLKERNEYYTSNYLGLDETNESLNKMNIPTRAVSLMFNMRSTDIGLGLPFNLASYGLLLMMIAKQVNMVPDELIYNGGDIHIYSNHIEPIKVQINREAYELPNVQLNDRFVNDISDYTLDDIILENYKAHPTIKMILSN